ncbi:MAG: class I SAM-dependent methyltransferase [Verrucomicrobia bacterium]|nr:class I SAM-dependent methyltransferase [Verrucomicrobiota bacterium]
MVRIRSSNHALSGHRVRPGCAVLSGFGLRASFGFRPSDFGFAILAIQFVPARSRAPRRVFRAGRPSLCYAARGVANPFYQPGEQRAAKVRSLFATVAPRYDLINDLQSLGLHRRWKRRVVELAQVGPGQRALDVCCGTGDLALALAQRGAAVTGLDFSEPMLAVARQRLDRAQAARRNHSAQASEAAAPPSHISPPLRVQFLHGDALRLPFPDEEFDAVTVGYGLRNLADWAAGLREMARVAKPGGRLLVLDFGKPNHPLWRAVYFGYLRLAVPLFGKVFCGDTRAYAYILESLRHYPAQEAVAAEMRGLPLRDVRVVNLLGGAMSINFGVRP